MVAHITQEGIRKEKRIFTEGTNIFSTGMIKKSSNIKEEQILNPKLPKEKITSIRKENKVTYRIYTFCQIQESTPYSLKEIAGVCELNVKP